MKLSQLNLMFLCFSAVIAACGVSSPQAALNDTAQCRYGIKTRQADASTLSFYAASAPRHTNKCVLPANLLLCSDEPVKSTDAGYEVKLLPIRNQALIDWTGTQDNDCAILSLIAWREMRSSVMGGQAQVIGPVVTPQPAPAPAPTPQPLPPTGGGSSDLRIFNEAVRWPESHFRMGVEAQCANFVREVLSKSCSRRFDAASGNVIQTFNPWDVNVVGASDLSPGYANSLSGPEIGTKISSLSDARKGDLVFFRNTYGSWPYGTITHIGIYAGDGKMIDRPTFDGPVMYRDMNMGLFVGALRVNRNLCDR